MSEAQDERAAQRVAETVDSDSAWWCSACGDGCHGCTSWCPYADVWREKRQASS